MKWKQIIQFELRNCMNEFRILVYVFFVVQTVFIEFFFWLSIWLSFSFNTVVPNEQNSIRYRPNHSTIIQKFVYSPIKWAQNYENKSKNLPLFEMQIQPLLSNRSIQSQTRNSPKDSFQFVRCELEHWFSHSLFFVKSAWSCNVYFGRRVVFVGWECIFVHKVKVIQFASISMYVSSWRISNSIGVSSRS